MNKLALTLAFYIGLLSCPIVSAEVVTPPARRIISLTPHITELLFAIGAGKQIVGTVEHSDFPQRARHVRRVGNHQSIDFEAALELNPDLILAWKEGTPKLLVEQLQRLGFRVEYISSARLSDIAKQIFQLGKLSGKDERADEVARHFQRLLNEMKAPEGKTPVKVYFQIWDRPIITVNGNHYINDVIRWCGGENIFSDLIVPDPKVGRESVIKRNPEVIFVNGKGAKFSQWLNEWRKWPQIKAVKNNRLHMIKSHTISRPTPRILMGVKKICGSISSVH